MNTNQQESPPPAARKKSRNQGGRANTNRTVATAKIIAEHAIQRAAAEKSIAAWWELSPSDRVECNALAEKYGLRDGWTYFKKVGLPQRENIARRLGEEVIE